MEGKCEKMVSSTGVPFQFGSCDSVFSSSFSPSHFAQCGGLCTRQALISRARILLFFSVSCIRQVDPLVQYGW